MEFKVTYADGTVAEGVKLIPSAARAIEAEFGQPFREALESGMEGPYHLAVWTFLRVRCGETRTLEEWLDDVDALEVEVPDGKRPTSGQSRKRSASSGRRSTKAKTSTD